MENKPQLYVKNEKGRYEPYKEPERPKYDNALYRRIGKKYVPCDMLLEKNFGWQEGVFVVMKHRDSREWSSADHLQKIFKLYRCGDIENVSLAKLGGMNKLATHLARHWNEIEGLSVAERAASVVAILFNYEKEEGR